MKRNNISDRWKPVSGPTDMMGAASFFLHFRDSRVILHMPRWCALEIERFIRNALPGAEERLYCTQLEEKDILFGSEARFREVLKEADPSGAGLCAVLVNGSGGLIGDDLRGIWDSMGFETPFILMDLKGYGPLYEDGWDKAMHEAALVLGRNSSARKEGTGLLGLKGMNRFEAGAALWVRDALGEAGGPLFYMHPSMEKEEFMGLLSAEKFLALKGPVQDEIKAILPGENIWDAPLPFGEEETLKWMKKMSAVFGISFDEKEMKKQWHELDEAIAYQLMDISNWNRDMRVARIIAAGSERLLTGRLAKALLRYFPDASLYIKKEGLLPEDVYVPLLPHEVQILIGSEAESLALGNAGRTIAFSMESTDSHIPAFQENIFGLSGWAFIMTHLIDRMKTMARSQWEKAD